MMKMYRINYSRVFFIIPICICLVLGKSCDPFNLDSENCGENEFCNVINDKSKEGTCECMPGFNRTSEGSLCSVSGPPGESHIAAAVLIPITLLLIVIVGVHYARKYKLVNWVRFKIKRYMNNYDDVMIGQDDD